MKTIMIFLFVCNLFQFSYGYISDSVVVRTLKPEEKYIDLLGIKESRMVNEYQIFINERWPIDTVRCARIIENYQSGKKNGSFYMYLNDTILFIRGYFFDDQLHGMMQTFGYDINGHLYCSSVTCFNFGQQNGPSIFYSNDITSINYLNKQQHGLIKSYYGNGKISTVARYKKDRLIYEVHISDYEKNTFSIYYGNETRVYVNRDWSYSYQKNGKRYSPNAYESFFDRNRFFSLF